jgi:hypothetical protein
MAKTRGCRYFFCKSASMLSNFQMQVSAKWPLRWKLPEVSWCFALLSFIAQIVISYFNFLLRKLNFKFLQNFWLIIMNSQHGCPDSQRWTSGWMLKSSV